MIGRSLGTVAMCRVVALATAAVLVVPLMGQTYTPPRTPWGDPDLQGMWPGNMGVPMQRPVEFGGPFHWDGERRLPRRPVKGALVDYFAATWCSCASWH